MRGPRSGAKDVFPNKDSEIMDNGLLKQSKCLILFAIYTLIMFMSEKLEIALLGRPICY